MKPARLLAALSLLVVLAGCAGGGASNNSAPTLSSITVTATNPSLIAGQAQQMKAVASYSDGSSKDVTASAAWTSSNGNIASVAAGGMLTAKAAGQCSIFASVGSVKGAFSLTVTPALVSIAVTPAAPSIAVSTNQQFIATGTYSDNSTQNITTQVTWASSNPAVATISTAAPTMGLARAIAAGSTTISASVGSISGSASLTVTSATVTGITVSPSGASLTLGLSQQFTASGTFSDGSTQDVTNVAQWHSSSSGVASITVSGFVTGVGLGSTTISATFGGVTGSTSLTVNASNVTSITITPANGSIAQGTQVAFKAVGTYTDGSTHDITHVVTWSSSDTTALNIGSISGLGNGIAPGSVNVTATLPSLSASVPFNVTSATIVSVAVTPTPATLPIGAWRPFTATGTFSDSSTQNITTMVSWTSSNPAVATVGTTSANYGVATSLSSGTTNIGASFSYAGASASGSAALTVSTVTLSSLALSPTSAVLAPGSGLGLTATGTFSDGSTEYLNPLLTWSSSDSSIAAVNQNGLVIGESAGIASITATSGSVSATASILVEGSTLTSLVVSPRSTSVPVGFWGQFGATGIFANGDTQDLTDYAQWTSSQASIATISNYISTVAQATGLQPGTTTISAVFAGVAGSATLTVTNATLTSITVTPSTASIASGSTQGFAAVGTFSDGSSMTITDQVTWTSSTPSVAIISARGVASAVSSGTTTISASVDGVTGMATLTVQ